MNANHTEHWKKQRNNEKYQQIISETKQSGIQIQKWHPKQRKKKQSLRTRTTPSNTETNLKRILSMKEICRFVNLFHLKADPNSFILRDSLLRDRLKIAHLVPWFPWLLLFFAPTFSSIDNLQKRVKLKMKMAAVAGNLCVRRDLLGSGESGGTDVTAQYWSFWCVSNSVTASVYKSVSGIGIVLKGGLFGNFTT